MYTHRDTHKGRLLPRAPLAEAVLNHMQLHLFFFSFNLHSVLISLHLYFSYHYQFISPKWQVIIYFCSSTLSKWLFYNLINAAECHWAFLSSGDKVSVSVPFKYHSNVVSRPPDSLQGSKPKYGWYLDMLFEFLQGSHAWIIYSYQKRNEKKLKSELTER